MVLAVDIFQGNELCGGNCSNYNIELTFNQLSGYVIAFSDIGYFINHVGHILYHCSLSLFDRLFKRHPTGDQVQKA